LLKDIPKFIFKREKKNNRENQKAQLNYHRNAWKDIQFHLAGGKSAEGNAIGGIAFEFLDEWWKHKDGDNGVHDTENAMSMPFPDGWSNEEWYGLASYGTGADHPFLRQLRDVYFFYREAWATH
jgi:hypothetical protein